MPARIEVDLRQVSKALKRMNAAGIDARPAFRKLRPAFRKDQGQHMGAQTGPSGASWAPLAPSTRERRLSKGGRAGKYTKRGKLKKRAQRKLNRILSKKLLSRAKVRLTRDEMRITSTAPWAGVHQGGGSVGNRATVPARPFMWVSDDMQIQAVAVFTEHLHAAWENRRL